MWRISVKNQTQFNHTYLDCCIFRRSIPPSPQLSSIQSLLDSGKAVNVHNCSENLHGFCFNGGSCLATPSTSEANAELIFCKFVHGILNFAVIFHRACDLVWGARPISTALVASTARSTTCASRASCSARSCSVCCCWPCFSQHSASCWCFSCASGASVARPPNPPPRRTLAECSATATQALSPSLAWSRHPPPTRTWPGAVPPVPTA